MLVTMALLIAMNVILTRFLGIQTPLVQINFSFVPSFSPLCCTARFRPPL